MERSICEGLRALGWGPEVDYVKEHDFQKFRGIDAVWQEKELTPVGQWLHIMSYS